MTRWLPAALAGLLVLTGLAPAQDGIRRGTVKKIDFDKETLTVAVGGKDEVFALNDDTRVLGASGKNLRERLRGIREGAEVFFKAVRRDGKDVLVGLKPVGGKGGPTTPITPFDTSKLRPLTALGKEKYQGFEGGLYPGGANTRPAAHDAAGRALAATVQPLDAEGRPDPAGKIVLLSVGMSNTTQEFSAFQRLADSDPARNPALVVVDGAQGGMSAHRIVDPGDRGSGTRFWDTVDQRLRAAGVTRAQVQAAWVKEADPGPNQGFPGYARTLQGELKQVVRVLHGRFPNLKLVYFSSRIYAGFARSPLNPEPYAYESGFAVRWLIEEQLGGDADLNFDPKKGPVTAPWLSWGPYLWANGSAKNTDGLSYEEADFAADGTHPSQSGRRKVAERLLEFFKTDATAKGWFTRTGKEGR